MLTGKKIVIIGATSGLGLGAAKAFIREGAHVVALGKEKVDREQLSGKGIVLTGDARQEGIAENAIEKCREAFGGFDGLYHVAGGSGREMGDGPLHEMHLTGWEETLRLNLTSLMLSNRAAVRAFLESKEGGSLLNISSVLGVAPSGKYFATHAYAAAKSAVIGFSKSLASYYAKDNIRVNVLAPGLVDTPMAQRALGNDEIMSYVRSKQPLDGGRIGRVSDLEGAAVYFMSDQSQFTTGQVLAVDGGWGISDGQNSGTQDEECPSTSSGQEE